MCVCAFVRVKGRERKGGERESERGRERERRVEREQVCSLDLCGAQTSVDAVGKRWKYLHSTFGFLSVQDKTNLPLSLDGELLTRGDCFPGIFTASRGSPSPRSALPVVS